MNDDPEPQQPQPPPSRRRIEEIFGRDLGTEDRPDAGDERAREDWYRENRPPHHDES